MQALKKAFLLIDLFVRDPACPEKVDASRGKKFDLLDTASIINIDCLGDSQSVTLILSFSKGFIYIKVVLIANMHIFYMIYGSSMRHLN